MIVWVVIRVGNVEVMRFLDEVREGEYIGSKIILLIIVL